MPSDFDLHYRFKNLPDEMLIKALSTEAYKHSEQARGIIRKILMERDVFLGEIPAPTLQRPDYETDKADSKDGSLFSTTYVDIPEEFTERAEEIFKHRNLDPSGEEEYKRFDLDKNTGSTIKEQSKKFGTAIIILYIIFRIVRFIIANN